MLLLSLQFGLQPLLTKECVSKEVDKTVFVLALEMTKLLIGITILATSGSLRDEAKRWTLGSSLSCAAVPAFIYAVQNVLIQIGLPVLSVDGYRIHSVKHWAQICRGCGVRH